MGGSDGGGGEQEQDDAAGDDGAEWPGLESLPPSPPEEYPKRRPYRPRRSDPPMAQAALGPAVVPDGAAAIGATGTAPRARSRKRWVAAAAVAVVVLLLGAIAVVGRGRGDDAVAAPPATTTPDTVVPNETDPSPPPTAAPPGAPSSTLAPLTVAPDPLLTDAIAEVSTFVSERRGLAFDGPVEGVRLPDAEFEARVREHAMADREAIEAQGNMLKLQGLMPEDTDWLTVYLDTVAAGTSAYFDPASRMIVIRGEPGTEIGAQLRYVLAHELTHALDFDALDLYERVYPDPATDQQFGLDSLVEGDAVRIANLWAVANGEAPQSSRLEDVDRLADVLMVLPYALGEALVDDIVARGGEAGLDHDFGDPPTTSEQVLHPEKYAAREPVVPLGDPAADGEVVWSGVVGELATSYLLATASDSVTSGRAGEGWGNGKGVVWVQSPGEGGLTCLRIAYAMDTPADLDELEDAFARWVEAGPNRSGGRAGDTLVVTSCARVPPPQTGVSPI